ncbi:MAG: aryl-sulfate sulfotransferase, partial [Myxococcota bacterium]
LPNGNLLALAWELKTPEQAIAAGRRPEAVPEMGLLSEYVIEIEPVRPRGGKIVWEWHVWDHLVQDHDPEAPHYGNPAEHPGRLDLNVGAGAPPISAEELEQLKALGYVPEGAEREELEADFLHANAIDYHAELDQIAISVPETGEVWIIDHGLSTAEAAGERGDLRYRWGNPAAYGRGEGSPARLFFQHDVRWIPEGWEGAGHLTLFNNGRDRPEGPFSSVDEIVPPLQPDGRYALEAGRPYGPTALAWTARIPPDRFAPFISGATRLRNGNTFVCAGTDGILLELTRGHEIVWEYRNPYSGSVTLSDGSPIGPGISDRPYAVFRATRIPPDHPALQGKRLAPLEPQPTWADPPAPPSN